MPQINQLPFIFWSQLFWLAVVFGLIFFVIGRGMLPKIQGTVELRDAKIAEDLERAQAARSEAEATEAEWRARMDTARAEAARLAQQPRGVGLQPRFEFGGGGHVRNIGARAAGYSPERDRSDGRTAAFIRM